MLSVSTLAALAAIGVIFWYWSDSLRTREQALRVCADACRQMGVQLLDQTVVVRRLRLGRDAGGRVRLRRHYGFEFSIDGGDRFRGQAVMVGRFLVYLEMDHPEGPVIQGPGAEQAVRHERGPW